MTTGHSRDTPLVGRDRELAALRAALDAALAGRGSLVLIGGEAGLGKTTLAEALCAEADGQGMLVLVGRCYDLSETPPYGPWAEALVPAPSGADLPPLPDAVLAPDRRDGATLAGQDAIAQRLLAYLAALAATRPLVLFLDDLHWGDRASLDLLRAVARGLAPLPLLLLATYRADEVARDHPLAALLPLLVREARANRLDLRPLDAAALVALVAARYPLDAPDRDRLAAYLAARTEGNALFAGELLRTLEGEGVLRPIDGDPRWLLGDLAAVPVPMLLRQVIDARLHRLAPETERLLAIAAIVGQEVPLALWAAVTDLDEGRLLDHAERALEARLLVETPGGEVRFAHALIREALYEGTPALRRRATHRRAAEALMAAPLPDPDAVASHLGRAGDARALAWLIRAGERALARHAPQAALDRLTRALDLAGRQGVVPAAGLYRARGLALETLGDFAGALADHEAALAAAQATGDGPGEWRAELDLGQLWSSRDYARVGEHYAAALAHARLLDDPTALADSLNRLGNWQVNTGRPWEGVALHREALALLEALGDRDALADTLDMLGMAEWIGTGEAAAAVHDFGRAIDLLRTLDRPRQLSSCLASRGGAAGAATFEPVGTALWRPEACQRDLEEAERLAKASDWHAGRAYPVMLAGQILTASGSFGPALARLNEAVAIAIAIDHRQWLAGTGCVLGQVHILLLAPAEARGHLETALALARDLGSSWWRAYAASYLALAQTQTGDTASAEETLAAALPLASLAAGGRPPLEARRLAWAWSEVRLTQGRHDEALALADDLLATAPGAGPIPALLIVRGEALRALGRMEEAERALDDAVRGALLRHERPRLWRAHAARVGLYRAQGRPAEAERAAADARAVVAALADTLPAGALRETFHHRASAALSAGRSGGDAGRAPAAHPPATPPFGLSAREAEVLRLVARGLTNAQTAERLFVTPRTVGAHLTAVYTKLGVENRAAAIRAALDRGLT